MRILVGWDNAAEAELLALYLGTDGNYVVVTTSSDALLRNASAGGWDVVLLALNLTNDEPAYEIFQQVRWLQPSCPVVGACHPVEVFRVARFMTGGMRSYLLRDAGGDFMFLLLHTLQSVVNAVRAERELEQSAPLRGGIEALGRVCRSIADEVAAVPGYRVAARHVPAGWAGGDYFCIVAPDERHLAVLVGDTSGHGLKAAMSVLSSHLLTRGHQLDDPARFLAEMNRRLCGLGVVRDGGGLVTLFCGILRADRHELRWACAGHPRPLVHDAATGYVRPLGNRGEAGLPLGIAADYVYQTRTLAVPARGRVLVYSDGLLNALTAGDDSVGESGVEALVTTLQKHQSATLEDTLAALVKPRSETGPRGDDATAVLLGRE